MKLRLPTIYSQWDSRWASEMLGFNTVYPYNIYNYGCLITCIAMVCKYYGKEDTPSTINKKLKDKNKFVSGGLYVWGGIQSVYTSIKEKKTDTPSPLTDTQINEIKASLDKGYPVMAMVDYNPDDVDIDMHYVLIIGYNPDDENDFTIADPLGGQVVSLKKYIRGFWKSARTVINQYIIYEGTPPVQGSLLTWDEMRVLEVPKENFEGKTKTVEFYFNEWEVEKKRAEKAEKEIEDKVHDAQVDAQIQCNKEIGIVQEEYKKQIIAIDEKHASELRDKQNEIDDLKSKYSDYDVLQSQVIDLQNEVKRLKTQTASEMPLGDLMQLVLIRLKSFFNKQ